jgi:hypothetical protein
VRDLRLIGIVATLWFVGGWLMGVGIQAQFQANWVAPCSWINVILGLVLLLLITQNPRERDIFYAGATAEDEDYLPLITLVLILPGIEIVVGGVWWLMAQFP